MYALLIAEDQDESAVCSLVLQRAGMAVTTARDVDRALRSWSERPADIILAVLADQDPLDQVRRVREQTDVPLVVITPPVREDLHYAILETGADMLIQRPYSSRLLIAQIRALLRRAGGVPLTALPALSLSGLILDPATHSVRRADSTPKRLTHLEFRLLYTLMIHRDQVLPTDTIVQRVWGYAADGGSRELVRGLISRLRAKVERDPKQPQYIHTIPGVGYAFQTEEGTGLQHLG